MLNNTPIRWISKRQKTVETSTYSSGLGASRVATELILEVRYMLRSLGVALDEPELMLGDNMSVVLITTTLNYQKFHDLLKRWLFLVSGTNKSVD
jgi:hypothetical protein